MTVSREIEERVDALEHFIRTGLNAGAQLDNWFRERDLQKQAAAQTGEPTPAADTGTTPGTVG